MIDRRGFLGLAVCGPAFLAAARALRPEPLRITIESRNRGPALAYIGGRLVEWAEVTKRPDGSYWVETPIREVRGPCSIGLVKSDC